MDKYPELITFLDVNSEEIVTFIKDVEPICNFHYPYEHHLTLGRFTDKNPEILRKFGNATLIYVKEQLYQHAGAVSGKADASFRIIINHVGRQPASQGEGFYLGMTEKYSQLLVEIHQGLTAFLHRKSIFPSCAISNYCPHVSLTTPITQSLINQHQETLILQTLNNKIAKQQGIILHSLAIRTILKYLDTQGNEQRETWDAKMVD